MSEDSLPFDEKYCPSIAKFSSGEKRKQEWEKSIKNPQEYWSEKAKAIDWFKPFSKVLDDSNPPFYKWFPDGELNISYNALDRHVKSSRKNKLAYIWEGEMGEVKTYTYYQLYREVNKLAKALKDLRRQKRRPNCSFPSGYSRVANNFACYSTNRWSPHSCFFRV